MKNAEKRYLIKLIFKRMFIPVEANLFVFKLLKKILDYNFLNLSRQNIYVRMEIKTTLLYIDIQIFTSKSNFFSH
jgi:hypothetical protein